MLTATAAPPNGSHVTGFAVTPATRGFILLPAAIQRPTPGKAGEGNEPDHVQVVGENFGISLIDDEQPLTEHVHLAFPAQDDATVRAFHAAALAAGYKDNGGPGERAVYHPGYYPHLSDQRLGRSQSSAGGE